MAGFTDLPLERRVILPKFDTYMKSVGEEYVLGEIQQIQAANGHHRIKIESNSLHGQVEIYFKGNGKTSFVNNTKNELKETINDAIEFVIRETSYDTSNSTHVVTYIAEDDFDIVIEFLVEECYAQILEDVVKTAHQSNFVKLASPDGDVITITRYKNGKMNIQGRPLRLYHELMSILSQFDINNIASLSDIIIDKVILDDELRTKMPTGYSCIPGKCKEALLASITLSQHALEVHDYSYVVFPALRTFEGHLKKVLCENNISANSDEYIRCFEECPRTKQQKFKEGHGNRLNEELKKSLEVSYDYYYNTRNNLFHQNSVFNNKIISEISEARLIVDRVIELIDKHYAVAFQ